MSSTLDFIFENFNTDGNIRNVPRELISKAINDYLFGQKKSKKSRKTKDPNAPKRPTSSYMIWLNSNRDNIKNKYFSDIDSIDEWDIDTKTEYYSSKDLKEPLKEGKPKLVALVTSKAGIIWKSMSDEDKLPYETQFKDEQQKYIQLKADYRPDIVVENQDIPEDWEGPHYNMMIDKTIKDDDGKTIKLFKSFNDAISKANELGLQCYGITETKTGYSVRIGILKECEKSVASWTKKDFVKPIKEKKQSKSNVTKETKQKMNQIFGDSSDSESENEESDDDDVMDVDEINVDGKTYYHDENTNNVYDPDSEECIGKYIDGKIVV